MNMTAMNPQSNVMANDAIMTPPTAAQATAPPEQAWISSDLECRTGVLEQFQNISDQPPQLPHSGDEIKRARAEKRLNAALRRMETEQKARLLAEARRRIDFLGSVKDDEMPGFPSIREDIFREQKACQELLTMEREQKEELLANALESLGREFADNWPLTLENPKTSELPRRSN